MIESISKELLSEVLGNKVSEIKETYMSDIWIFFEEVTIEKEIWNIHELAIKIVDKMITLGYVASLTKIKEHWWCEFATENYYKNNGIMCYGNMDNKNDIDTKSDDALTCAVKAYQWILEKKETK